MRLVFLFWPSVSDHLFMDTVPGKLQQHGQQERDTPMKIGTQHIREVNQREAYQQADDITSIGPDRLREQALRVAALWACFGHRAD